MSDLTPFLQTLRDRLTIADVIRPHVKLTRKGRGHTGLCPFHKEKTPSFTVNDEKGFYHCFGCGAHGDIFDFVMQKQNMPFMEAVELLANLLGLEVPRYQPDKSSPTPPSPKPDASLYEIMEAACRWYQQQLSLAQGAFARAYLEQRGLLPETINQFRLGYAPERGLQDALKSQGFSEEIMIQAGLIGRAEERSSTYDRFRGRLMFPIWDAKGRVIAFGGRILKEGEPKYLNSPDTPIFIKGKTLYAYNFALPETRRKESSLNSFIVAEGYMDVIAMSQAGFKTGVAPLGTALTHDQMALLWKGGEDPILCFDGDTAGIRAAYRAAEKALEILKVGRTFQFCFLPSGEDPDSLLQTGHRDEFYNILRKPQPLVDVLWSIFMQNRLFSTPEQKASARQDLSHLTKEIQDPDVRHFYREELTSRLQVFVEPKKRESGYSRQDYDRRQRYSNSPKLASFPIPRVSPKKNYLGHKILLATLINHPTLIEETAESLTVFVESFREYDELLQAVLSIAIETPALSGMELKDMLNKRGFASLLEEILTLQVYTVAPFVKETASKEEALRGWKEVWRRTVHDPRINRETTEAAHAVATHFQAEDWEKYKMKRLSEERSIAIKEGE